MPQLILCIVSFKDKPVLGDRPLEIYMLNVKRYVIIKWGNKVVPVNKMLKFITLKKGGDRLWVVKISIIP